MKNELLRMIERRKRGETCGIPSFCSANHYVIEAAMEDALRRDDFVLIEATSNQVNPSGGYMGMTSADFRDYVYRIAEKIGFPKEKLILGGDHLGPLPWCGEPAAVAMEKAKEAVRQCVLAGFTKVHLDTSMRLGSDDPKAPLSDETVAERGAMLYDAAMTAYEELIKEKPDAVRPVFVVGSEVPIPGGAQAEDAGLRVTEAEAFADTAEAYRKAFARHGFPEAMKDIVAVVVQPGVEFGETSVHEYNRVEAAALCRKLSEYPDLVFEGHSTDYQTAEKLREMTEDGIAILKVGPALTYAVREALFALSQIEEELLPIEKCAGFRRVLEEEMLANDKDWVKYYTGTEREKKLLRAYSFSDRSRYYINRPAVAAATEALIAHLRETGIPLCLLHQYMPVQYRHVRNYETECEPEALIRDAVRDVIADYRYATKFPAFCRP